MVVGAGFAGAVTAERLAEAHGLRCLVVDRRPAVAGMAHDATDRAGILVPSHGPHYFRTNSDRVRTYLSRFTDWRPITYRALAWTKGRYWQFPINLTTFEQLVGRPSTSEEMEATLARWREPVAAARTSEELIVSQVGRRLYELFYRGYTRKQWDRDAGELDPSVCGRIPIRTDRDPAYLTERFQAMPIGGFTGLIERILRHPRVELWLGTDLNAVRSSVRYRHLVYTGPIDAYYDHCFGALPYRSLRWEYETLERDRYQPAMQVNFPNDHEYTRILEPKQVTGPVDGPVTTIVREYPRARGEPFYAVPTPAAQQLYLRYARLAEAERDVTFVGRLATYRNYNMDQVVGMALAAAERLGPRLRQR